MNPFLINNYVSPDYFCDREKETEFLIRNINNQTNTTLLAQRRTGKSALIKHIFYKQKKSYNCIYIDLFPSQNLSDFVNLLANSIYQSYQKKKIGQRFIDTIKMLRPVLSVNELTGNFEVSIDLSERGNADKTIAQLFTYLDAQGEKFVIAFDEFQQILSYPEKNIEALLRTSIQNMSNCYFIFCGSNTHLMNELFTNSKRPFYSSTSNMTLHNISSDKYIPFCKTHFKRSKRSIEEDAIVFILESVSNHTYFVQRICHELYADGYSKIGIAEVQKTIQGILLNNEMIFYQYRSLLTMYQWKLLQAIALEGKLFQPYGKEFLQKHQLTATHVKRALTALIGKDMVFHHNTTQLPFYEVQDKLLALWFKYH
ncbi:MAG: ATP-binding protein [Brumimicrobium sp.]|nr:ATP-binding protein [Brumimicrobium sp.]MCO5267949.1 ATP-binding protein [Brumimicrobium sp.]